MYETCVICLDEIDVGQIFSVDGCLHRYCFSCMKQHVEVKLLNGMLPKCPHEGCNSELKIETSRKFLTPKLIEIMSQRLEEASIPVTEKIYCPYPDCSALMSKSEVLEYSKRTLFGIAEVLGVRKCSKCENLFCINCKVPWHSNTSCLDYKRRNPYPPAADAKLKTLADKNLWRQCVKCNHMIELESGCYHMTCRCLISFMHIICFQLWLYFPPTHDEHTHGPNERGNLSIFKICRIRLHLQLQNHGYCYGKTCVQLRCTCVQVSLAML